MPINRNEMCASFHVYPLGSSKKKMKKSTVAALAVALGLIFVNFTAPCHGALEERFYEGKCLLFVDVEKIVAREVHAKFTEDKTITAALLRLQFHDCFVTGCDASLLLDGDSSEKTAPPNLSVRGYDVIDAAKVAVERICPGIVSCADIIAMATRDAVFFGSNGKIQYEVQTGRRDGLVSLAQNVDLPSPTISVSDSISAFEKKGLNSVDMVYLLGGHTVGIAHCSLFQDRLYNYKNTGKPDPNMDPSLLKTLIDICPQNSTGGNSVFLDQGQGSSWKVDNSYYNQILEHRGTLQIDQDIALDGQTMDIVSTIASSNNDFNTKFGQAMVKLGAVGVLTGTQGEIRRSCQVVNKP